MVIVRKVQQYMGKGFNSKTSTIFLHSCVNAGQDAIF